MCLYMLCSCSPCRMMGLITKNHDMVEYMTKLCQYQDSAGKTEPLPHSNRLHVSLYVVDLCSPDIRLSIKDNRLTQLETSHINISTPIWENRTSPNNQHIEMTDFQACKYFIPFYLYLKYHFKFKGHIKRQHTWPSRSWPRTWTLWLQLRLRLSTSDEALDGSSFRSDGEMPECASQCQNYCSAKPYKS